jgi:hypothetical protein
VKPLQMATMLGRTMSRCQWWWYWYKDEQTTSSRRIEHT